MMRHLALKCTSQHHLTPPLPPASLAGEGAGAAEVLRKRMQVTAYQHPMGATSPIAPRSTPLTTRRMSHSPPITLIQLRDQSFPPRRGR